MEEQETFSGLGKNVYIFRKEDFQEGVSFDELKEKAVVLGASPYKSRVIVSDNPAPKDKGWPTSFSLTGEVELPCVIPIDDNRSLFGNDDDESREIKADVSFMTQDGSKHYFVKDATIKINLCPELPCLQPPLLWDKLPCDMRMPLCYPVRWGDKHFNRRIAHYQWLKQNNYL